MRRGFRCVNAVAGVAGGCGSRRVCLSRAASAVPVGPCMWRGYRECARCAWEKGSASAAWVSPSGVGLGCREHPSITLWSRAPIAPDSARLAPVLRGGSVPQETGHPVARRRHYLHYVRVSVVTAPRAVSGRSHLPMGRVPPSPNPTPHLLRATPTSRCRRQDAGQRCRRLAGEVPALCRPACRHAPHRQAQALRRKRRPSG